MKIKLLIMSLLVLFMLALPLLAQDGEATETFDPSIVLVILATGILGFPVESVIQILKTKLKVAGVLALALSMLVCLVASAIYFVTIAGWDVKLFLLYGLLAFASTQSWYRKRK